MAYRNGTYVAFHAGNTTNPAQSDIRFYNTLKMWNANRSIDFRLLDSHEKTASVRDTSKKETLRRALVTRLKNSKQFLLILTKTTRLDTDWVPFEIRYAIDECELPVIAVYPDFNSILSPSELAPYWPSSLSTRITNDTARVIHIPFKKDPVLDAVNQFDISNKEYPVNGYGHYNRETQQRWGLI